MKIGYQGEEISGMLCAFLDREISTAGITAALNDLLEQRVIEWLDENRNGFYGGCRMDHHSPQVGEFVDGLIYYVRKEFDGRYDS